MLRNRLATAALTAALAIVPAAALTAGAAAAPTAPTHASSVVHSICASNVVVLKKPGKGFLATLVKEQTIKVKRVSPSGLYVYGFARGTANRHGWVRMSALCPGTGGVSASGV